jgi:hypothetical protein
VFPRADRPIAIEGVGMGLIILRPVEGLEFVEEAVAAVGCSGELDPPYPPSFGGPKSVPPLEL